MSMSISDFVDHLKGAKSRINQPNYSAMERACRVVEAEAKREIGTYQEGWAELADSTKADRVRLGYSENDPGLRSGEMRDSIGHVVGHNEGVVGSDDDKLVWFELGTDKQPPRSVLALAAMHKSKEVAHILGAGVHAALAGSSVPGAPHAISGE